MSDEFKIKLDFTLKEEDAYPNMQGDIATVEARMKVFLKAYMKYGVIGRACQLTGITRNTVKVWRERFEEFKEAFDTIEEEYTDTLELEANRRALEKSDSLLQFLLRARRPEKFNPTQNVQATLGDGGIKIVFSEAELSPEERAMLTGGEAEDE